MAKPRSSQLLMGGQYCRALSNGSLYPSYDVIGKRSRVYRACDGYDLCRHRKLFSGLHRVISGEPKDLSALRARYLHQVLRRVDGISAIDTTNGRGVERVEETEAGEAVYRGSAHHKTASRSLPAQLPESTGV